MAVKIFLDTNIVLDYLLERSGELEEIEQLINLAEEDKFDCYVSESVLATTLYFLQKNKLDGIAILRELITVVKILPFKSEILFFPIEKFKDAEDGLLYYLAFHNKMNYFITRNTKDFKTVHPDLEVLAPSSFLKIID